MSNARMFRPDFALEELGIGGLDNEVRCFVSAIITGRTDERREDAPARFCAGGNGL